MKKNFDLLRCFLMISGILLISICVACYRLSGFGVDSFTGMNLGISGFLGMSFGTWQLIVNFVILIVVFFTVRHCIGLGTVVNMVCVGYIADFLCWLVDDVICIEMTLPLRILALLLATLFASLGVALYMKADIITALLIDILFCLASKGNIWMIVGIGTVCNSLFNGPLIQFFRNLIDKKLIFTK